jgi:quinol monooxygenase YgiN
MGVSKVANGDRPVIFYFDKEMQFYMATITSGRKILTLINVFTVKPEHQQQLVDVLVEADTSIIKKIPGYISASIHRSIDGTRVTNYAQWESVEALEAMLKKPEAMPHLQVIREIAQEMNLGRYEVVYSEEAL